MQHSFGDSNNTSIALIELEPDANPEITEVPIGISPKRNMTCECLREFEDIDAELLDRKLRIVLGTPEEIKVVRLTNRYKECTQKGVKIAFRSTRTRTVPRAPTDEELDLRVVLQELINNEDPDTVSRMNSTLRQYCPQLSLKE